MAGKLVPLDRIFETCLIAGAGDYNPLLGAQVGYQPFSTIGADNFAPYDATDSTSWEVGIGTYKAGPSRLQRTVILASSNGGAAVNWGGANTINMRCGMAAAFASTRRLSKSVAGNADVTLNLDEAFRGILEFTGVLTGNINVIVPTTEWKWACFNNTTGAFALTVKTAAGTGIAVTQGKRAMLLCDAANVASAFTDVSSIGASLSGGQCQLAKSGANLALTPKNGSTLVVNSVAVAVPSAGVTLASAGVLPTTTFRSRAANVATLTTAAAHQLAIGDLVNVVGVGGIGYNGMATVASTPTANTFTYANTGGNEGNIADSGGQIECDRYIYAFINAATLTLEAQGKNVAHSADAATGIEIKTGDATRSLVGIARIFVAGWVDSATQRGVRSWFNDPGIGANSGLGSNKTTTSTTYVKLDSATDITFLAWANEPVQSWASGSLLGVNANVNTYTALGIDGLSAEDSQSAVDANAAAPTRFGFSITAPARALAEGAHTLSLLGAIDATGTGTWHGGAAPTATPTLRCTFGLSS